MASSNAPHGQTPLRPLTCNPVNIAVKGFNTAPNTALDVDAQLGINSSGTLTAKATTTPDTGALTTKLDVKSFDLAALQPYVSAYTQGPPRPSPLLTGQLNTRLNIERAANGALDIRGDTEVAKLRAIDNALRQDLVKWDQLRIDGLRYTTGAPDAQHRPDPEHRHPLRPRAVRAPDHRPRSNTQHHQGFVTDARQHSTSSSNGANDARDEASARWQSRRHADPHQPGEDHQRLRELRGFLDPTQLRSEPAGTQSARSRASHPTRSHARKSRSKARSIATPPRRSVARVNLLSAALFTDMKVSFKAWS